MTQYLLSVWHDRDATPEDIYPDPEEREASYADTGRFNEEIRASGAHMLFVGMPTPFKETWCERHRHRLDVPVIMGVGGSFDVLAGFIKRAPRWAQSWGLEWFWRLLMEPRKLWKRYLTTNSEFIWLVLREMLRGLAGRGASRS